MMKIQKTKSQSVMRTAALRMHLATGANPWGCNLEIRSGHIAMA